MESTGAYTKYENPILINNSEQILSIKMSGESRYFLRNEFPVGTVWRGDNESSAFYAYIAKTNSSIFKIEELETMNSKLKDKVSTNDTLSDIISPLLNIFESGWYQIFYHEPLPMAVDFSSELNENFAGINNYNFYNQFNAKKKKSNIWIDNTILFTQNISVLEKERVEYYKHEIFHGKRPTIVTMGVAGLKYKDIEEYGKIYNEKQRAYWVLEMSTHSIEPQFIIDGHHKAQAYIELKVRPSIISCIKLQFKEEFDEFIKIEPTLKRLIENEIKEKIN